MEPAVKQYMIENDIKMTETNKVAEHINNLMSMYFARIQDRKIEEVQRIVVEIILSTEVLLEQYGFSYKSLVEQHEKSIFDKVKSSNENEQSLLMYHYSGQIATYHLNIISMSKDDFAYAVLSLNLFFRLIHIRIKELGDIAIQTK